MPINPTDFQNPDNFLRNYGDLEFEPIDPDDPGNGINALGCCKCSENNYCERNESLFGSAGSWAIGISIGTAVVL